MSISIMLILVVVGSLLGIFEAVQRTAAFTQGRVESTDEMRVAMQRLTKELRQATSMAASSTSSSLDMETYVNGVSTHVVYAVSGSILNRIEGTSTAPVLRELNDANIFAYTPSVAGAQLVTVTFSVKPVRRPDTVLQLTSEVRLRNEG